MSVCGCPTSPKIAIPPFTGSSTGAVVIGVPVGSAVGAGKGAGVEVFGAETVGDAVGGGGVVGTVPQAVRNKIKIAVKRIKRLFFI